MFNTFKQKSSTAYAPIIQQMALVMHTYYHLTTGMTLRAYSNPNPALWVEVK